MDYGHLPWTSPPPRKLSSPEVCAIIPLLNACVYTLQNKVKEWVGIECLVKWAFTSLPTWIWTDCDSDPILLLILLYVCKPKLSTLKLFKKKYPCNSTSNALFLDPHTDHTQTLNQATTKQKRKLHPAKSLRKLCHAQSDSSMHSYMPLYPSHKYFAISS